MASLAIRVDEAFETITCYCCGVVFAVTKTQYATLIYYPLTNTFGTYSRGATAVPIPDFNRLLVEAGFVDNAAHGGHGSHH